MNQNSPFIILATAFMFLGLLCFKYSQIEEIRYETLCTVEQISDKCYVVYPGMIGEEISCNMLEVSIPCYYYRVDDGITTDAHEAKKRNNATLLGMIIGLTIAIFIYIAAIFIWAICPCLIDLSKLFLLPFH